MVIDINRAVWFGNLTKAMWIPAPRGGMDAGSRGRIEDVQLANGGSFISQSTATHREYQMDWGSLEHDDIRPLYDFRNGVYGTSLLYLCDPWLTNAFAPHWAEPGLSGQGWPSLYKAGTAPALVGTGTERVNWVKDPNVAGAINPAMWSPIAAATLTQSIGPAGAVRGADFGRATATAATTAYGVSTGYTFTVTAGEAFSFSAYVRGTTSRNIQLRATWTGATATLNSAVAVGSTTAWQRLTYTGTVPAGATAVRLDILEAATSVAINDWFEWDGVLYERAVGSVGAYFDGNSAFADRRPTAWDGAVGQSVSRTFTPTANMPSKSARYDMSQPLGNNLPSRAQVLLIPPTKVLHLGVSGSATGGAGVYVQPVLLDGTIGLPTALTLLSPASTTRLNTSFSGATYSAVVVYLDTTTVGSSSVTLTSAKAVYVDITGSAPTLTGVHIAGEGHTGMRFSSEIVRTYISQRGYDGTQLVSAAVTLSEMGAWL